MVPDRRLHIDACVLSFELRDSSRGVELNAGSLLITCSLFRPFPHSPLPRPSLFPLSLLLVPRSSSLRKLPSLRPRFIIPSSPAILCERLRNNRSRLKLGTRDKPRRKTRESLVCGFLRGGKGREEAQRDETGGGIEGLNFAGTSELLLRDPGIIYFEPADSNQRRKTVFGASRQSSNTIVEYASKAGNRRVIARARTRQRGREELSGRTHARVDANNDTASLRHASRGHR